jgi:hypothetical protein
LLGKFDSSGDEIHVKQEKTLDYGQLKKVKKHLSQHELWDKQTNLHKDVNFNLPPLLGMSSL